nr:hypothetical protein [uncultured Campylobacter sp.]
MSTNLRPRGCVKFTAQIWAKFRAVNLSRVVRAAGIKFASKSRVKFELKFDEKPTPAACLPRLAKFKQDRFIRLKAKFL